MPRQRTVQHKPERESPKKEAAALKRENSKLRRQVSRLKKELTKSHDVAVPEESPEPVQETTVPVEISESSAPCCPLCGSLELAEVSTPSGKKMVGCKSCKQYRKVIE